VLYPARRLCTCEKRTCGACDKKAVVVEFQRPVRGAEPGLPDDSDRTATFFCKTHCPEDFPLDAPKPKTKVVPAATPTDDNVGKVIDYHEKYFGSGKKGHGAPHIDPVWELASPGKPPGGANSSDRVECIACKYAHRFKNRKLWNGSFSFCPKCGEGMYVPLWDEE